MRSLIPCLLVLTLLTATVLHAEERTWTSTDGKKVQGEILALEGDEITLKTARGEYQFSLSRLSKEDQDFARSWKETAPSASSPAPSPSPGAGKMKMSDTFPEVQLGVWPKSVAAEFEVDQIQIVKEDKEAEEYIYRSPHFEFRSPMRLSKSVVREFARIFEATFEFSKAIPIGIDPKPWGEGYYLTKLYSSRVEYEMDGGMPGSGGMHSYSWRGRNIISSLIQVPLASLGVEYTGTRFIVDHKKQSSTLVHEIAHQMTGRWLPLTPVWFKEGLAETISTQRYDNGRFTLTSMDRAIREDLAKRSGNDREFTMVNLERLMTMTGEEWAEALAEGSGARENYPSANVLFYYFVRLEGDGKGTKLVNYMKALLEGKDEAEARAEFLMAGRSFAELQEDMAKGWRSEGLRLSFR